MNSTYEYKPGPFHDFQEYPEELLEQMRLGAWMASDIETLETLGAESTERLYYYAKEVEGNVYEDMGRSIYYDIQELRGSLITPSTSYESLSDIFSWAARKDNAYRLKAIEAEARVRDGADDTDARYFYLAEKCGKQLTALANSQMEGENNGTN